MEGFGFTGLKWFVRVWKRVNGFARIQERVARLLKACGNFWQTYERLATLCKGFSRVWKNVGGFDRVLQVREAS